MKGDLALAAAAGIREHAFAEHTLKEQYLHSFFYFYFLRERQRGRRDDFCLYCCSVSLVTQQVYRLSTYMAIASLIVCGIIALIGYLFYQQQSTGKSKSQRKLPPGPKPLPILGNLKDFPPNGTAEYQHWIKHKDLYGGISSVTVMGMTLVIIHDKMSCWSRLPARRRAGPRWSWQTSCAATSPSSFARVTIPPSAAVASTCIRSWVPRCLQRNSAVSRRLK